MKSQRLSTSMGHVHEREVWACPSCGFEVRAAPFCPRDGTLDSGPGFSIAERYDVDELLGAGGAAFVFGGRHRALGKSVAIKVLRTPATSKRQAEARFLREARLSSRLSHPNIVTVLDYGEDAQHGFVFLVMERLFGPTLAKVVETTGPMPVARSRDVLRQLAEGLDAAHGAGLVHRDLSSRNVMVEPTSGQREIVKLCDFGLSRSNDPNELRLTVTGNILGTPAYMAPEQILGEPVDARSDLYAFGTVAYELLSGRLPFDAPNAVALIANKLDAEVYPLQDACGDVTMPAPLEGLVMRCLERDPTRRPGSAREIADALDGLDDAVQAPPKRGRRRALTLGTFAVALAAAAAVVAHGGWSASDRPARREGPVVESVGEAERASADTGSRHGESTNDAAEDGLAVETAAAQSATPMDRQSASARFATAATQRAAADTARSVPTAVPTAGESAGDTAADEATVHAPHEAVASGATSQERASPRPSTASATPSSREARSTGSGGVRPSEPTPAEPTPASASAPPPSGPRGASPADGPSTDLASTRSEGPIIADPFR